MSGTTPTEGYPYPFTSDFADVQDAYRLATAIDTDLRAEQAPFRAFMGRPSFIGRQTSNQSAYLAGQQVMQMQAVDWDNTGGVLPGFFSWVQPFSQQPSWWLFGCTILVVPTGSTVVGDMNMAQITVSTVDQVTGLGSTSNFYQRNDDSGTSGEWLNMFAMAPIYHGQAQVALVINGSTQKAIQAGSRFWGMYLGPVT
jgi:hypothetical protein